MTKISLAKLQRKLKKLVASFPDVTPVVKGSLVILKRTCGKPNCKCRTGKKHESLYLSRNIKGKTNMTYIPKQFEERIRKGSEEYKKILKILNEISEHNIEIMKYKMKRK